jgi:hypothetical protein
MSFIAAAVTPFSDMPSNLNTTFFPTHRAAKDDGGEGWAQLVGNLDPSEVPFDESRVGGQHRGHQLLINTNPCCRSSATILMFAVSNRMDLLRLLVQESSGRR